MKIINKIKKPNKKQQIPHYAALDIGTEFVKALVFKIGEGGKAHVVGWGRQRQRLGDMQGGSVTDIGGVVENCAKALDAAEEMADAIAESCIIGIAGELVKGTTTTVHYERLNPKIKIDYNELKNIVNKIQLRVFEEARKQLAWETGHEELDVKLVNASVVDVKIDGYRVTNPIGFQGKEVTVGVFNAFAPMVQLGALQSVAADLDLDLITIAAEPYAVARSLGVQEAGEFNAIFIDIGGGTTDIAVVTNGGVEGTRMFAIGGRSFTKRLANTLNVPFGRAEEIKLAYAEDILKEKSKQIVRDALYADANVWRSGVELALSEFSDLDLLPPRILLCGGGSALPEIKEVLSEVGWYKDLPFSKKPTVHFINPKDVVNIVDETGKIKDQQDITPMGLANLIVEMGEEDVLPNLMRKITKTLQV
jgi:cell division protein FtsA